jgi:hypothetical protein
MVLPQARCTKHLGKMHDAGATAGYCPTHRQFNFPKFGICALTTAGNAVVQDVAVTQYGMALHLPTWAAKDIEQLKLTADAKMRTAYRMFPAAVRQLHTWRLLTPAYNAVGAIGRQVRQRCLQSCAAASTETATLVYSRVGLHNTMYK